MEIKNEMYREMYQDETGNDPNLDLWKYIEWLEDMLLAVDCELK